MYLNLLNTFDPVFRPLIERGDFFYARFDLSLRRAFSHYCFNGHRKITVSSDIAKGHQSSFLIELSDESQL